MQKQEQLKEEIRLLLNLAISNLRPQRASADSKKVDDRSLEAGLSYIGLTLETAERSIAHIWNQYENETEDVTIKYPKEYSLKTDQERRDEATELDTLRLKIPSPTYQKEVSKIIANILLSHKINRLTVEKIEQEIEDAPLFGLGIVWFSFPYLDSAFSQHARSLETRIYPSVSISRRIREDIE